MAAFQQQTERYIRDLVFLDDSIEFVLKFCTKIAEIVLLLGIGYAGYKMSQHGHSNETLDSIWIISQILALDLSAPGLFAMARQAKERQQDERATWARRLAFILIVLSMLSMVEGAAEYYFHGIDPQFIAIASFSMMIARSGAAVSYSVFCRMHKAERVSVSITPQPIVTQPHINVEEILVRLEESNKKHIETATQALTKVVSEQVQTQLRIEQPKVKREPRTIESEPLVETEKVQAVRRVELVHEPPVEPPTELSMDEIRELPQVNMQDVIFAYLSRQNEQGYVPTNAEIMVSCDCSKNTAIKWKREFYKES